MLDTGASTTLMSMHIYKNMRGARGALQPSDAVLYSASIWRQVFTGKKTRFTPGNPFPLFNLEVRWEPSSNQTLGLVEPLAVCLSQAQKVCAGKKWVKV